MSSTSTAPVPNPVAQRDIAVVIGVLAVLEGGVVGDSLDGVTVGKVAERFRKAGLLEAEWTTHELRQVLHDLNQRLRYALGEYDGPRPPVGPVD
jgi:hypothetical protein